MKAINLLPPDLRGTAKRGVQKAKRGAAEAPAGVGAYVVLGALAACVLALAAYVLTTNTVKDRQAQLDATTAQAAATTQRVAQLKPYADFQAMAETRIQTVKDLASSRFDWEQSLRDVSRAIPADVTLESLKGSMSSETGGGGTQIRGAIAAPAIELTGCTKGQKNVATLLSRLRGVDGVTRVSLGKSMKADAQAGGTAPGAAAAGDRPPCGEGRTPAFEIVMFFERSKVPASVEDITVAPSAAAQPAAAGQPAAGQPADGTTPTQPGVTTPPADPAAAGAAPASTPQGGGS
jgi:Tfp pilus assembly protein PilN